MVFVYSMMSFVNAMKNTFRARGFKVGSVVVKKIVFLSVRDFNCLPVLGEKPT